MRHGDLWVSNGFGIHGKAVFQSLVGPKSPSVGGGDSGVPFAFVFSFILFFPLWFLVSSLPEQTLKRFP
jgi:hypothetical protein